MRRPAESSGYSRISWISSERSSSMRSRIFPRARWRARPRRRPHAPRACDRGSARPRRRRGCARARGGWRRRARRERRPPARRRGAKDRGAIGRGQMLQHVRDVRRMRFVERLPRARIVAVLQQIFRGAEQSLVRVHVGSPPRLYRAHPRHRDGNPQPGQPVGGRAGNRQGRIWRGQSSANIATLWRHAA